MKATKCAILLFSELFRVQVPVNEAEKMGFIAAEIDHETETETETQVNPEV